MAFQGTKSNNGVIKWFHMQPSIPATITTQISYLLTIMFRSGLTKGEVRILNFIIINLSINK